jgi:protein-disulfide isomerase
MQLRGESTSRHRCYRFNLWVVAATCAVIASGPLVALGAVPDTDQDVIGFIGNSPVREAAVVEMGRDEFEQLGRKFEVERHQLEAKYAQARHDLLQQQLDKQLDRQALELESKRRGVSTDLILRDLKHPIPTAVEERAFYETNRRRINVPFEQVQAQLHDYLVKQAAQKATRQFYDALRAKNGIRATLGPYRVSIDALGPARGSDAARVTIVEFADFQCPFCKAAESSLRAVIAKHARDVRLVFRNLPLEQLHPNAKVAAEAGVCADRQGKFWEMHDAMYDDQSALGADGLTKSAQRLGLNVNAFSACLADASTEKSLAADAAAAQELGLDGTPSLFINGRPIVGDVPVETLEGMISDELRDTPGLASVPGGPH